MEESLLRCMLSPMSIISDNGLPMWCIVSINSRFCFTMAGSLLHYAETKTKKTLLECLASGP